MTLAERMHFAGAVVKLATLTVMTLMAFLILVSAPILILAQIWM